jgi:hypothetical protein
MRLGDPSGETLLDKLLRSGNLALRVLGLLE